MKKNRLKILFFPAWYPNPNSKVAGIFIQEHAKALNKSIEIEIAVFHVFSNYKLNKFIKYEVILQEGITVYRVHHKKYSSKVLYLLNVLLYALATGYGYCKTHKIFGKADINHVHVLTRTGFLPFFLRFFLNTPYIITEHWSRYLPESNTYSGFMRKWCTKIIVKYSLGLSTVSVGLKKAMDNYGLRHENYKKINNTVDTDRFNFLSDKNKENKYCFKFLHVSGLQDRIKNVSGILKAVSVLQKEGLKFELHIVGDDPDREFLEKYSHDLGLSECVAFHGKLYGKALISHYHDADAFVLFSNFENQPCVLLESFCVGLPVISTSVGGISEIVNNQNGVLIAAKDEAALAVEMRNFINNKYGFNRQEISKEAQKMYSHEAVARQLRDFYEKALTK